MCVLDTPAQCVCYNPDGTMLAVGLGGGVETDIGEWHDHDAGQVTSCSSLGRPFKRCIARGRA